MLKFLAILSIVAGVITGYFSADEVRDQAIVKETSTCEKPDTSEVFETNDKIRCVSRFNSKGDKFVKNNKEIAAKFRDIFARNLKDQKVRPNDFNVYLQKNSQDKVRRYDPRIDIFQRFGVKTMVRDNAPIANYSLSLKTGDSLGTFLRARQCPQAKLSKIRNTKGLLVFEELEKFDYASKSNRLNSNTFERKYFSAFEELEKKSSWYMYFVGTQNYIENYLVVNQCNKTVAIVLNHCVINPAMDMQLEEVVWFKKLNKIGINIYCKNSLDSKWTYQTFRVMHKQ